MEANQNESFAELQWGAVMQKHNQGQKGKYFFDNNNGPSEILLFI